MKDLVGKRIHLSAKGIKVAKDLGENSYITSILLTKNFTNELFIQRVIDDYYRTGDPTGYVIQYGCSEYETIVMPNDMIEIPSDLGEIF